MTCPNPPASGTVVVGVDGSAACAAATRWAAVEATRRRARLRAVHVVERGRKGQVTRDRDFRLDLDDARRTMPGRVAGWVFRAGIDVDIAVSVVTGDVAAQLAREATDASLIVIGAPDSRHHSDLPADLANRCPCSLVVVGAFGDVTYVDATHHPVRPERSVPVRDIMTSPAMTRPDEDLSRPRRGPRSA